MAFGLNNKQKKQKTFPFEKMYLILRHGREKNRNRKGCA